MMDEGDADKPVVGEGRLDHVLDGEKVLDDHVLLDVLVEYVSRPRISRPTCGGKCLQTSG